MKDHFLLADSELEVYQEWVLLLKYLKKVIKIHHEYAARPLTKSYNCYYNSPIYNKSA